MRTIYLILLIFSVNLHANSEYTKEDFVNDWQAPLYYGPAKSTLLIGSAITGLIILGRESTFDKIQEDMADDEPMGDLAVFGDYMGQLVPNLLYMGGMYWNYKSNKDIQSYQRYNLMLKTTFFAGLTTTLMKRIVNQKRPHGGDRLSFPSGHTTTAFAFASVVALEHSKAWGIAAYSMATIVGLSRMNDNAHYLHDVTFGATLGIIYGMTFHQQMQKSKDQIDPISWNVYPYRDGAVGALLYNF